MNRPLHCEFISFAGRPGWLRVALVGLALAVAAQGARAQCPATTPVQGAVPPSPIFPADNWWNTDITAAPVDPGSASYISFIGTTRGLHPDFGGEASPGSTQIYGFPYAIVGGSQPKQTVSFE